MKRLHLCIFATILSGCISDRSPSAECTDGTCDTDAAPQPADGQVPDGRVVDAGSPDGVLPQEDGGGDGAPDEDLPAPDADAPDGPPAPDVREPDAALPDLGPPVPPPPCVEATAETCNGRDDDCDGAVDEGQHGEPRLQIQCFDADPELAGRDRCRAGVRTCVDGAFTACTGQVLPAAEICNLQDDDCDGEADEGLDEEPCYTGPPGTAEVGVCRSGRSNCRDRTFGICRGEQTPLVELCDGRDNDCDGQTDEGLDCGCIEGDQRACYSGPPETRDVGPCRAGVQTCTGGRWSQCRSERTPGSECERRPADNDCDGFDGVRSETACSVGSGVCRGTGRMVCVGEETFCDIDQPGGEGREELCNGEDDDCDGWVDELYPQLGQPCTAGVGACAVEGTVVCRAQGFGWRCDAAPGPATPEVCNDVDDDCDGEVDERCGPRRDTCGDAMPQHERCNGEDDDCDGEIDEAVPAVGTGCQSGTGRCARAGNLQCVGGPLTCDADAAEPVAEVCNNLDDDCDGAVDEGLVDEPCTVGQGACANEGEQVCTAGVWHCSVEPRPAEPEACDGQDNDCDGAVDEGLPVRQPCVARVGQCERPGRTACEDGEVVCDPAAGGPIAERCDGLDNDCDGVVDELDPDRCEAEGCGPGGVCACPGNRIDVDGDGECERGIDAIDETRQLWGGTVVADATPDGPVVGVLYGSLFRVLSEDGTVEVIPDVVGEDLALTHFQSPAGLTRMLLVQERDGTLHSWRWPAGDDSQPVYVELPGAPGWASAGVETTRDGGLVVAYTAWMQGVGTRLFVMQIPPGGDIATTAERADDDEPNDWRSDSSVGVLETGDDIVLVVAADGGTRVGRLVAGQFNETRVFQHLAMPTGSPITMGRHPLGQPSMAYIQQHHVAPWLTTLGADEATSAIVQHRAEHVNMVVTDAGYLLVSGVPTCTLSAFDPQGELLVTRPLEPGRCQRAAIAAGHGRSVVAVLYENEALRVAYDVIE